MSVSPEEFIRAWQTSSSVAEVASKLGMNPRSASTRRMFYTKLGIPLKRMKNVGREKLDVVALASLAESLGNGSKDK